MRISQIRYGVTKSDGYYGNQRIECTVDLEPGDDANNAFSRAHDWVERKLAGSKEVEVMVGGRSVTMPKAKADALMNQMATAAEDEEIPF